MGANKPTAQTTTHQVEIKNMAFEPASVSIAAGDTVEWKNTMGMAHTATGDNGEFDSGPIASNQTFSQVFNAAATIPYHCEIHPFMTGTVVVASPQQAQTHQVEIKNMAFNPASVSIAVGDTVEWKNTMGMAHTATGDNGEFDSGPIASNQTFSQVFNAAATIPYHCEIHPFMTGTVVVASPQQAQTHQVEIKNMAFEPASISIAVGDTVEWKNTMGMAHTATGDNGEFDSGPIASNQTFSQVFNAAATIPYHCEIHPFMTGTIVVA